MIFVNRDKKKIGFQRQSTKFSMFACKVACREKEKRGRLESLFSSSEKGSASLPRNILLYCKTLGPDPIGSQ